MKIYTKTGDQGTTSLLGCRGVSKAHPRVEAYGLCDELNSVLGWTLTACQQKEGQELLRRTQHNLFVMGSHLACVDETLRARLPTWKTEQETLWLEQWIDERDHSLPPLKNFILPGGTEESARFHVARTTCRRAERELTALSSQEPSLSAYIPYFNRLSDALFVAARWSLFVAGQLDPIWNSHATS